jgi:hypothetical protein
MKEDHRWLPTKVEQNCKIYVTSRVEGFFGLLKSQTNHNLVPLKDLCVHIKILAEMESDDQTNVIFATDAAKYTNTMDIKDCGEPQTLSFNYHDLQANFEPYFSMANRSEKVQTILSNTMTTLQQTAQPHKLGNNCIEDPPTFQQSGTPNLHPVKNSHLSGTPKKKKTYHCSFCQSKFHNKHNCPNKQYQNAPK